MGTRVARPGQTPPPRAQGQRPSRSAGGPLTSAIDIVPIAERRRPEKGTTSGERPHWELMLMRPTMVDSESTIGAAASAEFVKMAA